MGKGLNVAGCEGQEAAQSSGGLHWPASCLLRRLSFVHRPRFVQKKRYYENVREVRCSDYWHHVFVLGLCERTRSDCHRVLVDAQVTLLV